MLSLSSSILITVYKLKEKNVTYLKFRYEIKNVVLKLLCPEFVGPGVHALVINLFDLYCKQSDEANGISLTYNVASGTVVPT